MLRRPRLFQMNRFPFDPDDTLPDGMPDMVGAENSFPGGSAGPARPGQGSQSSPCGFFPLIRLYSRSGENRLRAAPMKHR
mgnify:CR=1 FL=1